jgi:hypothetical protein
VQADKKIKKNRCSLCSEQSTSGQENTRGAICSEQSTRGTRTHQSELMLGLVKALHS